MAWFGAGRGCLHQPHLDQLQVLRLLGLGQREPQPPAPHCSDSSDGACLGLQVFKPGSGTITVYANTNGQRGALLYTLPGIPLTPGCAQLPSALAPNRPANASSALRVLRCRCVQAAGGCDQGRLVADAQQLRLLAPLAAGRRGDHRGVVRADGGQLQSQALQPVPVSSLAACSLTSSSAGRSYNCLTRPTIVANPRE